MSLQDGSKEWSAAETKETDLNDGQTSVMQDAHLFLWLEL